MKVFIAWCKTEHSGSDVVGVYSTSQDAFITLEALIRRYYAADIIETLLSTLREKGQVHDGQDTVFGMDMWDVVGKTIP